jgi:hypothetical protein
VLELFGELGADVYMGPSGEKVKRLIVTEMS